MPYANLTKNKKRGKVQINIKNDINDAGANHVDVGKILIEYCK